MTCPRYNTGRFYIVTVGDDPGDWFVKGPFPFLQDVLKEAAKDTYHFSGNSEIKDSIISFYGAISSMYIIRLEGHVE